MKAELESYFDRLWPINRSITGNGVRETLKILGEIVDLKVHEVPTGTKAFDWTVPREWNAREAYILTPDGKKIADFSENNLHLLGYSVPFKGELSLEDLLPHLYSIEEQPEAIPYRTSYYTENWGFCITDNQKRKLAPGKYKVVVDTDLKPGSLTYADAFIKGKTDSEILFSTYVCHPSMANNELSGPLATAFIYRELSKRKSTHYSYRFVFAPETIGAIVYLSKNGQQMKEKTKAGFVVNCVGDNGKFTYKRSRSESLTNELTEHLLSRLQPGNHLIEDFVPEGSDERQYCSPGFDMPVGLLMRTMYGQFREYHTSLDNKSFISFEALQESVEMYMKIIDALEINHRYVNTVAYGEPQLGKRGLYPSIGLREQKSESLKKILNLLNYSDGKHDLIFVANKLGCTVLDLEPELRKLIDAQLLKLP